jgi:triosephosphate isomerase
MTEGRVDGFLVGGASLKVESLLTIAQAANDCYDGKR